MPLKQVTEVRMLCERCGETHTGMFGSGRFCSRPCANARSHSTDTKSKISASIVEFNNSPASAHKREKARETCASLSQRRKTSGYVPSANTRELIRQSRVGKSTITEAGRARLSVSARERGLGGHTSKNKVEYVTTNGTLVYLQSSYELTYARFLDECGVRWSRPPPLVWVDDDGIPHRYYPDFLLTESGIYVDTKNDYLIVKDADKIAAVCEQNSVVVKVLSKRDLTWVP